jgi:hypothetical protein
MALLFRRSGSKLLTVILVSTFLLILFILTKYFIKNENHLYVPAGKAHYHRNRKVNI